MNFDPDDNENGKGKFFLGIDQLAHNKFTTFQLPNDLMKMSLKRASDENKFDIFL